MRRKKAFLYVAAAILAVAYVLFNTPQGLILVDNELRPARYRHGKFAGLGEAEAFAASPKGAFKKTDKAEALFRRARRTGDDSALAEAEDTVREALKLSPRHQSALVLLAEIHGNRHDFNEALRLADEAMRAGTCWDCWKVIITSHLALGRLDEAKTAADTLLSSFPTSQSYLLHALVSEARGEAVVARADFRKAAAREEVVTPEDAAQLRSLWARFFLRVGDYRRAGAIIHQALKIAPRFPFALSVRGDLRMAKGDFSKAAEDYLEAFQNSRTPRYLIAYARAKKSEGEIRTARESVEAALELIRSEMSTTRTAHAKDLEEAQSLHSQL